MYLSELLNMEHQHFQWAYNCWIALNYGYMPYDRLAHMFQHLNYTQLQKTNESHKKMQPTKNKKKRILYSHSREKEKKKRTLTYMKKE